MLIARFTAPARADERAANADVPGGSAGAGHGRRFSDSLTFSAQLAGRDFAASVAMKIARPARARCARVL